MLGNHCFYSPTSLMLKRRQKNVLLELQNQNEEPLQLVIACGPIKKIKGHSKINDQIKRNLYAWMIHHPQVVHSLISNDCLKVMFDDQTEPQLVPKSLLHMSVRELHNSLVSDTYGGGLKGDRYEDIDIIISNYTLCSLLPPQFKKYQHDTRSCVVVNFAFLLKVYIRHYYPGVIGI